MSDKGSISLEATIGMAVLIIVSALFFSIIYGSFIQSVAYSEVTEAYLRLNHEPLSERTLAREISLEYSELNRGYHLVTFGQVEDEIDLNRSSFHEAVEYMTFVTDTGSKFHRPFCPTVKLSLRPILYDKAIESYEPCSVCRPKK